MGMVVGGRRRLDYFKGHDESALHEDDADNTPRLAELRERIDDRVREMRETEGPALLQGFSERAAALGLTVDELMQGAPKRRGRPSKDREEA